MICHYLPYTLSLRAPAVLAAIEGDPNSTRSLPYVPGSALRGAAARGLGDPGQDAERALTFRTVILDGSVRFLNAYPRAVGRRTLPTPVSLRIDKTAPVGALGEIRAWDLAAFDCESDTDEESWPVEPRSAVPEPFVSIGAAQPLRVQPARGSRIHQQRERSRGRAWKKEHEDGREEAHGAVFAFEFLEGGQEFDGVIQIRGEDDAACDALAASVQGALQAPILLGRSRRSGYGGDATISWGAVREREVEGQGFVNADLPSGTEFRALLTSPYVGRDPDTGQIDATRVEAEIVEALGGRVEVVRRRWSFERVGGFNRKWRLELPQALACAAGSVLVLRTSARVPRTDLLAVEHAGLGERRVEGFGRAIFLGAPVRKQMLRTPGTGAAPRAPEGDASELVRFAERRILDAAVQRAVEEEAVRLANGVTALPTSSVLGRLRNAMRADPEQALATLRAWLAPEGPARLKRPAMVQLERCRLKDDRSRLSDWLREMAAQEDGGQLAKQLRLETIAQRSSIISEVTANEHLTRRAPAIRSRFVDTALAALARRTRKEKSS